MSGVPSMVAVWILRPEVEVVESGGREKALLGRRAMPFAAKVCAEHRRGPWDPQGIGVSDRPGFRGAGQQKHA
jgi:hypothetical protein